MFLDNEIQYLKDNGAGDNSHSSRCLLDHLTGTAALLSKWNCDKDVVLAGLYHSVYGTDSYHTQTLDDSKRGEVREIIGERAEHLAWEFGKTKNPRVLSFMKYNQTDLIILECANLIEQKVDPSQLSFALAIKDLPDLLIDDVKKYLNTY